MRIISGEFKGRRFQLPKNLQARPTTDFAKENLFNILSNRLDFEELKVLDLFAGTGSIGFECCSRGAISVTFVEQYAPHVQFIREVTSKLKVTNCIVAQADVYRFLETNTGTYNFIFSDAPYADKRMDSLPDIVLKSKLLSNDGLLIVEHGKSSDFTNHPNFLEQRIYGSVHFSFFEHKTE
jgi:16S rRNA (guanine966-N2)-methyltransferase